MNKDAKAVIVTGGGKRLGAIISRHLAEQGWHVLIHYRSSDEEAAELADELKQAGHKADILQADLDKTADIEKLVDEASSIAGDALYGLVNSASVFEYDNADQLTAESLRSSLHTNLEGPVLLSLAFARKMPETNKGCIVNILDQKLWNLNPDFLSYTISKQALHGATETLAMALAPRIRVVGVAPGLVLPSGGQTQEEFEAVASKYNLTQEPIDPENVASAIAFALANNAVTGSSLLIDNGQHRVSSNNDIMFNTRNTQ